MYSKIYYLGCKIFLHLTRVIAGHRFCSCYCYFCHLCIMVVLFRITSPNDIYISNLSTICTRKSGNFKLKAHNDPTNVAGCNVHQAQIRKGEWAHTSLQLIVHLETRLYFEFSKGCVAAGIVVTAIFSDTSRTTFGL